MEFERIYGESVIELPTSYTKENLKCNDEEVPAPSKIKEWVHLQTISDKLPDYDPSLSLGLIIGGNCPKVLEPQEIIPSIDDGPYASRSILGWRIIGPIGGGKSGSIFCHKIGTRIHMIDTASLCAGPDLILDSRVKDTSITESLEKMYHHEFPESNCEKKSLSNEDKKFVTVMEQGIEKVDGHYQLPLPLRNPDKFFPDNKYQALQRLRSIKNKMSKDASFRKEYCDFMSKILAKGYAVKSEECPNGKTWYLPHFGVQNPNKKFRVVFDCSVNFNGSCLNDELIQGPDLTNLLSGVLLRFRRGKIGYSADIEAMFYQVLIPPEQQSLLKFLWWPNGDFSFQPATYQMRVHTFGAVSSPSCANFALRHVIEDSDMQDPAAKDAILNNFYVDDMLNSDDKVETVKHTVAAVQELCESGGFNLTKFVCKEKDVMESIPLEKRSNQADHEIDNNSELIERALGVHWCLESDTLEFRINLQDTPLTRRGILSTISSIYDPLGIASPFLLKGRKILQKITALSDGWDSQVPSDLASDWIQWRKELPNLEKLLVQRCYKPDSFGDVQMSAIHIFSDASEEGYGVACYLRQVDANNTISVSLVLGKSRVSPLKSVTIPRLELTAATSAVKIAAMVKEELKIPNLGQSVYWTDSQVCLGYIFNEVKRFRVFVANRVSIIRSYTQKDQWNYVESSSNPADHASRGLTIGNDEAVSQWINGPAFLWQKEEVWIRSNLNVSVVSESDPEIKRSITVHASKLTSSYHSLITTLEERISNWNKMVRVVATMKFFVKQCQTPKDSRKEFVLSVKDLLASQRCIVTMLQSKYMPEEVKFYQSEEDLSTTRQCRKKSALWKLDPFLSYDGILRIGGRLSNSSLSDEEKHPVIIPGKSEIARRIVEYYHKNINHLGRTSTLNELRQNGFWVLNANTVVRSIINKCTRCKYFRGNCGEQKMADLPEERFSTEGPFTITGMDMFGPFYTRQGRKTNKRYVVLFTCLSSRAVHLETTADINTDSFIQALRRFISRRGKVCKLFSDNGKNFIGAENELKKAYNEMDHSQIRDFLLEQSCDLIEWKKNPPSASHMGGAWERLIQSVRNILKSMFKENSQLLNDESFQTFLTEAECIINSRPLTISNLSDPTSLPLSPNNILTMKTRVALPPPGKFQQADVYCRKRWRQVQYLADIFWNRWKKEFLSQLQERQKWNNESRNFKVNDIVLLKDVNMPRSQWPIARISKTYPSDDGFVRKVQLFIPTSKSELQRPIQKLILLVSADQHDRNGNIGDGISRSTML